MHFRQLAEALLQEERVEEAFVAFDAGRALGYAAEVDEQFFSRVITQNPFASNGSGVDRALLYQAQQTIGPEEVAVVLAVIPLRIVAFLVGRSKLGVVTRQIAATQKDLDTLDGDIKMLSHRLAEGIGLRAVPNALLEFAKEVAKEIGDRAVSCFIPYDSLHLVPWRSVLRHFGLPWRKLAFSIGFNFLMRQEISSGRSLAIQEAIALGHGRAGDVDLREEAVSFATAYGGRGSTVLDCTAEQVRQALQTSAVVLLSCHGKAVNQDGRVSLALELADGSSFVEVIIPSPVLSPLVILSACDSGVYYMAWSDYPLAAC